MNYKTMKYITIGAAVTAAAAAAVIVTVYLYKKRKEDKEEQELEQKVAEPEKKGTDSENRRENTEITEEWIQILKDNAKVFVGLYSGMAKAAVGKAKHPEKVLREWYMRAKYKWENVYRYYESRILPLIEGDAEPEEYTEQAGIIMEAVSGAGISKSTCKEFTITDENAADWSGGEFSAGERVRAMAPAWYQNGSVLEKGYCEKVRE